MPRKTLTERFWEKVIVVDGDCWPWMGRLDHGYGYLRNAAGSNRAHRIAFELFVGPVPDGLVLDHLCHNPCCVNPSHLEPVTQRENTLRGESHAAQLARNTHCKHGHEFTPENIYRAPGFPNSRYCRECTRERGRSRAKKRRTS